MDDDNYNIDCFKGENIILEIHKKKGLYKFNTTSNDNVNRIINNLTDDMVWRKICKDKPRQCRSYFKKIKGLTPKQHLEHQLYKGPGVSISRWALFWSIVAVFVSLGALIVSIFKT